jgi:hypothetical protein
MNFVKPYSLCGLEGTAGRRGVAVQKCSPKGKVRVGNEISGRLSLLADAYSPPF